MIGLRNNVLKVGSKAVIKKVSIWPGFLLEIYCNCLQFKTIQEDNVDPTLHDLCSSPP